MVRQNPFLRTRVSTRAPVKGATRIKRSILAASVEVSTRAPVKGATDLHQFY